MIEGIVGPTGCGKTLLLTKIGLKAMKKGRRVFSNYGLLGSYKIPFELLPGVRDAVVLIDEVGDWFNSRDFAKFPPEVGTLLRQSRKHGLEIYWTTQHLMFVDVTWRRLTDAIWLPVRWFGRFFSAHKFDIVQFDKDGELKPGERPVSRCYYWLSKKLTSAYDTYALIEKNEKMEKARRELELKLENLKIENMQNGEGIIKEFMQKEGQIKEFYAKGESQA